MISLLNTIALHPKHHPVPAVPHLCVRQGFSQQAEGLELQSSGLPRICNHRTQAPSP